MQKTLTTLTQSLSRNEDFSRGAEPLSSFASLIDVLGDYGTERVMLGMAHRGRLNVLANIFNKPIRYIDEFDDEAHHI